MAEIWIDNKFIPVPRESPNSRADRDGKPPIFIVLHSTGGGFAGAVRWLMNRLSRVSAHFVVSREGVIRQLVSIHRVAYHAGKSRYRGHTDLNSSSIGIEMEHFDGKQDWPEIQIIAVQKLLLALCMRLGIRPEYITTHATIAWPRGRKVDPLDFPLRGVRRWVKTKLREFGRG